MNQEMKCPYCITRNVQHFAPRNSFYCQHCNKEFPDIPETIRYQNAPSQNAIDEAYKKGYLNALRDVIEETNEHVICGILKDRLLRNI